MDRRFDEIVEFSGIEKFIDSPVQNYSSGMAVRLGFAVAINMEPDILLIDEVLAVGDTDFQLKCYQKLHDLKMKGTSFVLVAHNEYTIREQTQKCAYLKDGKLEFYGPTEDGVSYYIKDTLKRRAQIAMETNCCTTIHAPTDTTLKFIDGNKKEIDMIESGAQITLAIECDLKNIEEPIISINFYSDNGFFYCINSQYENVDLKVMAGGLANIYIDIMQFHLPVNNYSCSLTVSNHTNANVLEWQDKKYHLIVNRPANTRGNIRLPNSWKLDAR